LRHDFDAATVLSFLRGYGLFNEFKLNIEANHATLAGHTFEHELTVASAASTSTPRRAAAHATRSICSTPTSARWTRSRVRS
jgi:hypothetical protein